MSTSASLEHWFSKFNRKERYHLLINALVNTSDKFEISKDYKSKIIKTLQLDSDNSKVVFVAMDYHLDWMHVALQCYKESRSCGNLSRMNNDSKIFKANQQDVDLLVIIKQDQLYNVVMIEAKADTGWNNDQLKIKADRLKEIYGYGTESFSYPNVKPFYILSSPKESVSIDIDKWPGWMFNQNKNRPYFLKMDLPRRIKVSRKSSQSNQLCFTPYGPN